MTIFSSIPQKRTKSLQLTIALYYFPIVLYLALPQNITSFLFLYGHHTEKCCKFFNVVRDILSQNRPTCLAAQRKKVQVALFLVIAGEVPERCQCEGRCDGVRGEYQRLSGIARIGKPHIPAPQGETWERGRRQQHQPGPLFCQGKCTQRYLSVSLPTKCLCSHGLESRFGM